MKNLISLEEFITRSADNSEKSFNELKIKNVARHYYMPVILGNKQSDYIQHIIREESEVRFLEILGQWLETHTPEWEAWSFSKIDESLDKIYIPYYDYQCNEYAKFRPDFIFWMHRENEYQIIFVDPKGAEHTSAERKIDGYENLFVENGDRKIFPCRDLVTGHGNTSEIRVSVGLLMFNEGSHSSTKYQHFWTCNPADIFRATAESQ